MSEKDYSKLPYIREYFRDGYAFDGVYLECDIGKDEFEILKESLKTVLDAGETVHYNDEHGVGSFRMIEPGKYKASHWRHHVETCENVDFETIVNFIKDFFRIGYLIKREW